MIEALKALGTTDVKPLPSEMKAFGIVDLPSFLELFSTHPPLSARIKALSGGNMPLNPPKKKPNPSGGLFGSVSSKHSPWN